MWLDIRIYYLFPGILLCVSTLMIHFKLYHRWDKHSSSKMYSEMSRTLLLFIIYLNCCDAIVIDYSATKMLTINRTNTYFGYSILLQRGNPPIAIVGAPKNDNSNGGTVYQCNLKTSSCKAYTRIRTNPNIPGKNGDFLGSVLDGNDITSSFVTCAPRFVTAFDSSNHYAYGRCFYIRNAINVADGADEILPLTKIDKISTYLGQSYYDAAFGEAGFDLVYFKDQNELIVGAPGKSHWRGALVQVKLSKNYRENFPSTIYTEADRKNWLETQDSYFGYAVSWGRFIRNSDKVWYVSGSPRSGQLKGTVAFYDKHTDHLQAKLSGEEFGSYFGSSLLVLHYANGGDDILVGAPMLSGKTWDEGCVYYYKNQNTGTFYPPRKLMGKGPHSRFGSVIADVGDIDLNSYRDCAIAAPYEDEGTGAVYLYFGGPTGFSDDNFHRISPSNFMAKYPNTVVRGFGIGISRGNDMDDNGHTDFAVGAYQSGQVFYFTTYDLVDVEGKLTSNIPMLYSTTRNFSITYCLRYTQRNKKRSNKFFTMQLLLKDDRIVNQYTISTGANILSNEWYCKEHMVKLKDYFKPEPVTIIYKYKTVSEEFKEEIYKIPVSSGCREDICRTNLSVKATLGDIKKLIVGMNKELRINVSVENSGEPAFATKLYLTVPPDVSLINLRECYLEQGNYTCVIPGSFRGRSEKSFLLDLANLQPDRTNLEIKFRIRSDGVDNYTADNEEIISMPVGLENTPHIDTKSRPDNIFLTETKRVLKMDHYFLVGNQGPSPLRLAVVIMVPKLEINGTQFLDVTAMEDEDNGFIHECIYLNVSIINLTKVEHQLPQKNNSVTLSCFDSQLSCMEIFCQGRYFPKSSENAVISLKLKVSVDSLAKFSQDKDAVVIASTAYINNGTKEIFATAMTTIYGFSSKTKVPLWIYICSAVAGIILFLLMTLILYKYKFFNRTYKERLENEVEEMIMQSNEDQEEEPTNEEMK